MLEDLSNLAHGIAALLWPIFAFTALFLFRSQIADLAARLKKGKLLGQEIELDESLDQLKNNVESMKQEVGALPAPAPQQPYIERLSQLNADEATVENILSEALRSPKAALIILAGELEKLARQILASTGHLRGGKSIVFSQAINELDRTFGLPRHVPSSLKVFWDVRNKLVHGRVGDNEDILRAIDSGLTILRALQAMPREINIVYDPAATLYEDPELQKPMPDVKGVILESHAPGGATKSLRIFPTTKTHFKKGQQVSWEWNMGLVVGPAWYRNPVSGEPALAFSSAAEFIGRDLEEV